MVNNVKPNPVSWYTFGFSSKMSIESMSGTTTDNLELTVASAAPAIPTARAKAKKLMTNNPPSDNPNINE